MLYRLLLLMWLFLAIAANINAEWEESSDDSYNGWEQSEDQYNSGDDGLNGLVSDIHRRREGRVLSTDTFEEEGRPVHRIRILNERGRVRSLHFDGATGQPLPRFYEHRRYQYRRHR